MKTPFVFVLMDFAPEFGDVYELGIKPACGGARADCARVDEQIFLENILERIYGEIERADIVVAEMTGRNPNVFYEVGYAHGLGKPVILLTKTADDIPFDLRQYPHVTYGNSIATLKRELEKRLAALVSDPGKAMVKSIRSTRGVSAQLSSAETHINNYLNANNFQKVSFERVRKNINESYTDEMLCRLIDERPQTFRRVVMKGGQLGIGRIAR